MTFLDYFNASKFIRTRSKYRREYANALKKIIEKYELDIPLTDTYITKPLTSAENALYHTSQWQLKKQLAREYGFNEGKADLVSFTSEYEAKIYRIGAQTLSNILAENKARVETKYCMDLVNPGVVAAMIAGYFAAKALQAFVLTAPAGIAAEIAQWAALIALVSGLIAYIVNVANANELENFNAIVLANDLKLRQWQKSNSYFANRKLSRGSSADTFLGYANYANGFNYLANTAGSESFYPTQAYNPTEYFAKNYTDAESNAIFSQESAENPSQNTQNTQDLEAIDDRTQGRSHYDLAGNEGYKDQVADNLPLQSSELLPQNHLAFRQNMLKNDNLRLLQGFANMAEYLGSNDDYSARDYLQSAYEWNFNHYSEIYYRYAESNMFIENVRVYNKALRANIEHFSTANEKTSRKRSSLSRGEANKLIAEQIAQEADSDDPKVAYDGLIFTLFISDLQSDGREETFYSSKSDNWDFSTSAEYKIYEKKFIKSLNAKNLGKLQGTLELSEKSEGVYTLPADFESMVTNTMNEVAFHNYHIAYTASYKTRVSSYSLKRKYKTFGVLYLSYGNNIVFAPSRPNEVTMYFSRYSAAIQAGIDDILATM